MPLGNSVAVLQSVLRGRGTTPYLTIQCSVVCGRRDDQSVATEERNVPVPGPRPSITNIVRQQQRWLREQSRRWASLSMPVADAELEKIDEAEAGLTEVADFGSNPGALRMLVHLPENLPPDAPLVVAVWRRLLNRLILAWRQACSDAADPSAVIIDSRSCRSAPTCFGRGFDGGKKIKGIKIHLAVDKYGFPLAINVSPANRHDSKGIVPVPHQLAGFKGTALGDLSYRGQRLSKRRSASPSNPAPTADPSFRRRSVCG